ncbi:MAG: FliI/YscN family ATPase [Cypionkella sp.]|nr:FliI/YscN family ATPase [Cypionkella sp.]
MRGIFDGLLAQLDNVRVIAPMGRVSAVSGSTLRVVGIESAARQGDRVMIAGRMAGEVIGMDGTGLLVMADGVADGIALGAEVRLLGVAEIAPDDAWIGRIIDPYGQPLDGRPLFRGPRTRHLRASAPPAAQRRRLGARLPTGVAVFDTMLPLARGQRIGLFAGSGVGKSSLLAKFARGVDADVVVIALVGERGRELREFVERVLGPEGMARAVVIAATSDQSALVRKRCALAAMAVAEHFRDQGRHVLLLTDSVTRFAEAHREVALAAGEAASMRGFPPSVAHAIMSLAERAGPGPETGSGDITAVFTVLVAGSDMEEPIADILRGVLDGHVVMDRAIAERGRFPAVDVLRSISRSLPQAASADENQLITLARQLLGAWDRSEMMIQAGLYVAGSDAMVDAAVAIWPALDGFLAEDAPPDGVQGSFVRLAQVLGQSSP